MEKVKMDFSSETWKLGVGGEDFAQNWLIYSGAEIVHTNKIKCGGAPMLEGNRDKIILPDTLAYLNKERCWVEIKTKSYATLRKCPPCAGRYEHGIPLRHWNDYCKLQNKTSEPVFLAFLQLDKRVILIDRIDNLKYSLHPTDNETPRFLLSDSVNGKVKERHVFFGVDDFEHKFYFDSNYTLPKGIHPNAFRTIIQLNNELINDKLSNLKNKNDLWG